MKLSQILPLYEAIHISSSDIQKISTMLTTFKRYVNEHIDEFDDDYEKFEDVFTNRLQRVIVEIISQYYHTGEQYQINVNINPDLENFAEVYGGWGKHYSTWYNNLEIRLSKDDLKNLNIPKVSSAISHEITHLIQSLKAARHSTKGSKVYNKNDKYYSDSREVEAYAQSVASDIMNNIYKTGNTYGGFIIQDINKYIKMIKSSYQPWHYSDELIHYHNYKNMYKTIEQEQDWKIWKLFNKKIIQKLQKYKEEYSHPNNSARYDVYQNDELIDSVWYGINDDVEDIRRGLINHDGYDENIIVKRTKRKTI
jgi:predicted SprT family Zn-dependent metalloprotease